MSNKAFETTPSSRSAATQTAVSRQNLQTREGDLPPAVRRAEQILAPTGPFREIIERYMKEAAPDRYVARDLVKVRGDLTSFFRFVFSDLNIEDLDDIRPSTVTRFVESRRAQGYTTFLFLGKLATFFVWAISVDLYDNGNPVVNRLHRKLMTMPGEVLSTVDGKGQHD